MDVLHAAWAVVGVLLCGAVWFSVLRRTRRTPAAASIVLVAAGTLALVVGVGARLVPNAQAQAPAGQGFTLNGSDLKHILKQIKIAEHHATTESGPGAPLVGPGEFQIANPLLPYGLRTVDGSENNLQPDQDTFGAADQTFPRLATPQFRSAEDSDFGLGPVGPPGPTSYTQKSGSVVDSQPRVISNLIVDQTSSNPAAVQAAGVPHRTFLGEPSVPCTTEPDTTATPPVAGIPTGCTPAHETLFIPNVTTDVGLSPPYNSWFTLFGQFFDHGVDFTEKAGGTVFVPLKADDPLIAGPDHILNNDPDTAADESADNLPASQRFMVLTRVKNRPGPDNVLGTSDDVQEGTNTDTPWVDQSQTYTSHPSHQVFLRAYALNADNRPVSTGKLLEGADGGMATWAKTKEQAASMLGIKLTDSDALNIPLLATDQYGRFLRGPARGMPQMVTPTGLVEGNRTAPVDVPNNVTRTDHAFLDDIAHNAVPKPGLTPDTNSSITGANGTQDAGTYDDEMLDRHFIAGDGRVNENIGLTAVHQIFHSEHNRLVDYIEGLITAQDIDVTEWQLAPGIWNGERIFQAARFVTEMEYQHLVFEEFARKIQPLIDPFQPFAQPQTDVNPAIPAEFAHAVYRFGHSMLTDTIARVDSGGKNDIPLLDGFLNPPSYTQGSTGTLTPHQAAGSIIMGMTDQAGNELDEFVAETLRNKLLGLPLDLPTLNMTRARDAGVPSLNNFRRQIFNKTNDGSMKPYTDWVDFALSLKHPYSVVNFMAAYGKHPSITSEATAAGKRGAAKLIYDNDQTVAATPADSADFVNGTGAWASTPTGLDDVDLWVGGLAEKQNLFGGLLGSTFNYVFEQTLTNLQNGDRLYYLARTPGMNLRSQLEGNSFAELIMRNTDAHSLKADVFSTADCEFELANLAGTTPGNIADDPASECDESKVLIRMADGTIRYREQNTVDPPGLNAQSTFNGTSGNDKVQGGVDNDTFWGNEGNDRIEGGDGADVALGGIGNDIITDMAGDDVLKGGDGNDAIDGGPGLDILMTGEGDDFADGGLNINETFAAGGDDKVLAGNGEDAVFGDGGNDWEEGGNGPDLLIGDSSAPFFDDMNAPGDDVLIGDGGDDDYDGEGGEDILAAGSGIEKSAGADGWDWFAHYMDPQPADTDLDLQLVLLPAPVVNTRDKFNSVEGLSGGRFDDKLRGRNDAILPGTGDLDQRQIDLIPGLQAVVGTGVSTFSDNNDIIMGGAGADLLEGRGGDDIIEGDKWLKFQLRSPDLSTPSLTDTKLSDSMTTLRADVFAGRIDPGDITIARSIEAAAPGSDIDTAVFSGPRANYTITPSLNSTQMVVTDTTGLDGTDTVRGVERLQVSDISLSIVPSGSLSVASLVFAAQTTNTTSVAQTVTITNGGQQPLSITALAVTGANATEFVRPAGAAGGTCTSPRTLTTGQSCTVLVTFRPTVAGTRSATLRFTDNNNGVAGSLQDVALTGTGVVPAPVAGVNPASLAFAARATNTTSPAQTVTLLNTGTAPLAVSSIVLTGDFARSGGTCPTATGTLAAGASCTVAVTFRPVAGGARAGTLRFTDNSGNVVGSTQTVTLGGTGIAPQPTAGVTPATLTFATRATATTSAAQTVTLSNSGNAALAIASIAVVGTNPGDFARSGGTCPTAAGTLAAGASCTVGVTFRPTATGARTATLRVSDNSGNNAGSTQDVTLNGTGRAPAPGIGVTPTPVAFGNNSLLLGGAGVTRTITVTSNGELPVAIGAVTITGPNAANFTFTGTNTCANTTRAVSATCTITVRFRAGGAFGAKNATLNITSNALNAPTTTPMTGNATL
jgi:Ca2+-binding RTX toxin-like protein